MPEGTNRNMANSTLDRIRQRITLDSRNGWIAGVCAGVANYLNTDPAFVRVAAVISALFMPKVTAAVYLVAWLVLDDERRL
jgi:phage shock protein C